MEPPVLLVRRNFTFIFPHLTIRAVLAGALLEQSEALIDKGIHPIRIADGFDRACAVAVQELDRISDKIEYSKADTSNLLKSAMTSLGSKMFVLVWPFFRCADRYSAFLKNTNSLLR